MLLKPILIIGSIKKSLFFIIVKTLSLLNNVHKRDLLDILLYLIFSAKGHYRGFYNLDFEVKICSDLIKKMNSRGQYCYSNGTIIDVGANKGEFFQRIRTNFPEFKYYLFEPQKKLHNILKNFYSKKVNIYNFGLSNSNKILKFYENEAYNGLGSYLNRKHEINENKNYKFKCTNKIKVKRFDQLKISFKVIDLVKIDVEGLELKCLNGFGNLLKKVKIIQFEWGRVQLDARNSFLNFWLLLKRYNFDIFRIHPSGLKKINNYSWFEEIFISANLICINQKYFKEKII